MKIIVYVPQITNRVDYIFSTLLTDIGFEEVIFTSDINEYKQSIFYRINYSDNVIEHQELWIIPAEILFETTIRPGQLNCSSWNNLPCFYTNTTGDIPFDVFGASFYLLTRYEEYLQHCLDEYGRYAHTNSLAFKNNFLHLPLINLWMAELKKILIKKFSQLPHPSQNNFLFIPTYDIDLAWSYKQKGCKRNIGGLLKDIIHYKWANVANRLGTLMLNTKDPFDCYDWLNEVHTQKQLRPIYFFLLAKKNKGYDKNIHPDNVALQNLINSLKTQAKIGIHPSWQSNSDTDALMDEINTLSKITGTNVVISRQHFIRFFLPDTYRTLIDLGITDDYTMGYGSINGFRASYCKPFKWFDIEKNCTTSLTVHPFCYMDANAYFEQKRSAVEALEEMKHYYNLVKSVNGELIFVMHNHLLGHDPLFKGWREAYRSYLELV